MVGTGLMSKLNAQNKKKAVLYRNIDQKLVNSLHGLLNCEIGGLDFHAIV